MNRSLPLQEEYYRPVRARALRQAAARVRCWAPRLFLLVVGVFCAVTAGVLRFAPPLVFEFLCALPVWLWALWLSSLAMLRGIPVLRRRALMRLHTEADVLEAEHQAR